MARFIYVQCICKVPLETLDEDYPWFRHAFVEADDEQGAYDEGHKKFPTVGSGEMMLNDYVVEIS